MDGKKKKNRKKKGTQGKAADDAAASVEDVVVADQNHGSASEQNHHAQVSGNVDVQSVGVSESDAELERHKLYEEKCEEVTQLEDEKLLWMQKEVNLQEEVTQLEDEKLLWMQKEASLEEKIKLLQNDIDSCIQKEASLEKILKDLQIENYSYISKEAILEEKVKHIEGIKDSWVLNETSTNEMIARLDEATLGLQMQVKELKESRDSLVQENIHLMESIKAMESRIQHLETEASFSRSSTVNITEFPEGKTPEYQIEAAQAPPVERLDAENAKLVEKVVNEVYEEQPDQHVVAAEYSTTEPDRAAAPVTAATTPIEYSSEYGEEIFESGEKIQAFGINNGVMQGQLLGLDDSRVSEEIVPVPLDDIQVQEAEPQAVKNNEEDDSGLPLSDAPLIGAPFRLISFVAKYVSGADLASQDRPKSHR